MGDELKPDIVIVRMVAIIDHPKFGQYFDFYTVREDSGKANVKFTFSADRKLKSVEMLP